MAMEVLDEYSFEMKFQKKKYLDKNGNYCVKWFPVFEVEDEVILPPELIDKGNAEQICFCNKHYKNRFDNEDGFKEKILKKVKFEKDKFKSDNPNKPFVFDEDVFIDAISKCQTPPGRTWHHNEELGIMQLILTFQHEKIYHTGGGKLWNMLLETKKKLVLFFLIDTSGSMEGTKIATLNDVMREIISDIKDISDNNADTLIKIAVLAYSSGAEWITSFPQELDSFHWQNLEAGGCTDLGEACFELNDKLNSESFLRDGFDCYAPVIILITDGEPTDDFDSGIKILNQNPWFKKSIRIAFHIGSNVDFSYLESFTENKDFLMSFVGRSAMQDLIRFVPMNVSEEDIEKYKLNKKSFKKNYGKITNFEDDIEEGW